MKTHGNVYYSDNFEIAVQADPLATSITFHPECHLIDIGFASNRIHLEEVDLNNVIEVKSSAFEKCTNLKKIKIGKALERLDNTAFAGCYNVESIEIDKKNKFYDNRENCNAIIKKQKNELVFGANCSFIPESVKFIGPFAFAYSKIKEIKLPKDLNGIKDSAFTHSDLEKIEFPKRFQYIGDCAFQFSKLQEAIIPDSVIHIGSFAFFSCSDLKKVRWSNKYPLIPVQAFSACSNLEILENTKEISSISNSAFLNCKKLNHIKLDSATLISEDAFKNCIKLDNVTITPNPALEIKDFAFFNTAIYNKQMKENSSFILGNILLDLAPVAHVSLREGITRIASSVFRENKVIKLVICPSTLKTIEPDSFRHSSLRDIVLNDGLESIGHRAFQDSELTQINFPKSLKSIGWAAFVNCTKLKNVGDFYGDYLGHEAFGSTAIDNLSFIKNVQTLQEFTFVNCKNLKKAVIPPSVEIIGYGVFENAGVESLVLHNKLFSIDSFGDMPYIKNIVNGNEHMLENNGSYISKLVPPSDLDTLIDIFTFKELNKFYKNINQQPHTER